MTPHSPLRRSLTPRGTQRGSEIVEFALIAMLYFTVIFLIIETGLLIRQYNTVALVAHEGARYACVRKNVPDETIQNFVQQRLNMLGLPGTPGEFAVTRPTNPIPTICIKITYNWVPITPIVGRVLGTKIPLTKNACMPLMQ
jgi:Flp pilus assembly protein TadG